jgi:D-alanine-D-alanine ligase
VKNNIVNTPNTRPHIAKNNKNGNHLPKKVAIIHSDDKREYFSTYEEYMTEAGALEEAQRFFPYLKRLGIEACAIAGNSDLTKNLKREKPDMVINIAATVKGYDYLGATIPATLELLEIPYTGAAILGFSLGCNKYLIYALLSQHGVPVPRFQLMTDKNAEIDPSLRYPLILKLNEEHSNVEIKRESIVEDEKQLRKRAKYLMKTYDQDVLISEFIDGREFASFVVESYNKKVYTFERKIHLPHNKSGHEFLDYDLVWRAGEKYDDYVKHKKYKDPLLTALVKKAFSVTKMDDYGKFDIRMDRIGNYYFIDANANCHMAPNPKECDFTLALNMYGISFTHFLKRLLQNTMREWGL